MGLFTESVPRELYDRECARADKAEQMVEYLTKQIVALKKKGHELAPEPVRGRVVNPPADAESRAMQRMHEALVSNLAEEIENAKGIPKEVARQEAEKLRALALGDGTVL